MHARPSRALLLAVWLPLAAGACVYAPVDLDGALQPGDVRGRVRVTLGSTEGPAVGAVAGALSIPKRTRTDPQGAFTLRNLPAGDHTLVITLDSDGDGRVDHGRQLAVKVVERAGRRASLDVGTVRLGGAGTVRGSVRLEQDGACSPGQLPPAGTWVVFDGEPEATAVAADGTFEMRHVVPGQHHLFAGAPGHLSDGRTVDVADAQDQTLTPPLCLRAVGSTVVAATGTLVTEPGVTEPLPDTVVVRMEPLLGSAPTTGAAERGAFTLPALPPSIYAFVADVPDPFETLRVAWLVLRPDGPGIGERVVVLREDGTSSSSRSSSSASSSAFSSSSSLSSASDGSSVGPSSLASSSSSSPSTSLAPNGRLTVTTERMGGDPLAPGDAERVVGRLTFRESSGVEPVRLTSVTLSSPATVGGQARLYVDRAPLGTLGPEDALLAEVPMGSPVEAAVNVNLGAAGAVECLVTFTVTRVEGVVDNCDGLQALVSRGVGLTSGVPLTGENTGQGGAAVQCVPAYLTLDDVPIQAADGYLVGTVNAPLRRLAWRIHGGGSAVLSTLSFLVEGSGSGANDTTVRLFHDVNRDARVGPLDVRWAEVTAVSPNTSANVPPSAPLEGEGQLLLTLDVTTPSFAHRTSGRPQAVANMPVVFRGASQGRYVGSYLQVLKNTDLPQPVAPPGAPVVDVLAADLDQDGFMDVLWMDALGQVRWRRSQGMGGWLEDRTVVAGDLPAGSARFLRVADLNRDGWPDVLRASTDALRLHPGSGDGVVGLSAQRVTLPQVPTAVAVGDVLFNGYDDVVVAHAADPDALALYANEGGTLSVAPAVTLGGVTGVHALVLHDVDRNGFLDILARHVGGLDVVRVDAAGMLATPQNFAQGSDGLAGMVVMDFSRDGVPDVFWPHPNGAELMVGNTTPSLFAVRQVVPLIGAPDTSTQVLPMDVHGNGRRGAVLLADGTIQVGSGVTAVPYLQFLLSLSGAALCSGATADFNGDGDDDLFALGCPDALTAQLFLGDGRRERGLVDGSGVGTTAGVAQPAGTDVVVAGVTGDFDRDGWLDLCVATASGLLQVWRNNADPQNVGFTLQSNAPANGNVLMLAAADVSGDGMLDAVALVAAADSTRVRSHLGDGLGNLSMLPADNVPVSGTGVDAVVADLNRDSRPDIMVLTHTPDALVPLWRTVVGLEVRTAVSLPMTGIQLQVADVTNPAGTTRDGIPDAVVLHESPASLTVVRWDATGAAFQDDGAPTWGAPNSGRCLGLARLDWNGEPDLVVVDALGVVHTLTGNRTAPAFFTPTPFSASVDAPTRCRVHMADMDGDADEDVVVASELGWQVLATGNRHVLGLLPASVDTGTVQAMDTLGAVMVGDFNQDGDLDVVGAGRTAGAVSDELVWARGQ